MEEEKVELEIVPVSDLIPSAPPQSSFTGSAYPQPLASAPASGYSNREEPPPYQFQTCTYNIVECYVTLEPGLQVS